MSNSDHTSPLLYGDYQSPAHYSLPGVSWSLNFFPNDQIFNIFSFIYFKWLLITREAVTTYQVNFNKSSSRLAISAGGISFLQEDPIIPDRMIVSQQLMISGDVETNPGPIACESLSCKFTFVIKFHVAAHMISMLVV